jgi:Polysaccharide lyase
MSKLRRAVAWLSVLAPAPACEPALVLGELPLVTEPVGCTAGAGGATGLNEDGVYNDGPMPAPWHTGFEDEFCGYRDGAGFCYADVNSAYGKVESPVKTGSFAAVFELRGGERVDDRQARCVREGVLPEEAYYSAWYYLPPGFSGAFDWNLFHFQSGQPGQRLHGTWDISLDVTSRGQLVAYVADYIANERYDQLDPLPVPIGEWFKLEFYLKRAADETGEIALYQDGQELLRREGVITDDSSFTQWYVGNFAGAFSLPPSDSTSLYVDDVAVRLP